MLISTSKVQKLRKMSVAEVRSRTLGLLRRRHERRAHRQKPLTGPAPVINVEGVGRAMVERMVALVPGSRRSELQELSHRAEGLRGQLVEKAANHADQVLDSTWPMLGHEFDLTGEVDWHADPRTGHQFPHVFYADVPLHQSNDDDVDVKYVWELGRHQYLAALSRAWLLGGDQRAAVQSRQMLLSWIDTNRLYEGVHWTSGLEVAVRAISWIWTLAALAEWNGWREGDLDRIAASLVDHATYLEHHFSFYSSPYNHLIGESTGLYLIARVLEHVPEAAKWRQKSRDVLEEHGPKQFYSDGFCVEQATGYHFFTLGFLSMAIVAARQEQSPLLRVEEAAHRAFRAGILFQQPNGRWPAIGDVDSARSIPVHHEDFWDFSSLCSLGAVLFDDPQLKRPGSEPGEELCWLLGCDGVKTFDQLDSTTADGFAHLEESGYVLARQGGYWLCFDAGPIAHGLHTDETPSTAHGHLDTLQVLYCHNGEPVLIDPGMPFYFGDREWVRHFRGASAHNTLQVDGVALAKEAGRLGWSCVHKQPDLVVDDEAGAWQASGRIATASGIHLERSIEWKPASGLTITDRITLDQPRSLQWGWQLVECPDLQVSQLDASGIAVHAGDVELKFRADEAFLTAMVASNDVISPSSWLADGYGLRSPRCAVVVKSEPAQQLQLTTVVRPAAHSTRDQPAEISRQSRGVASRSSVTGAS